MTRQELWDWIDTLNALAFSSAEPLEARQFYAEWWLDLTYAFQEEIA
jgi:hypothetical protein